MRLWGLCLDPRPSTLALSPALLPRGKGSKVSLTCFRLWVWVFVSQFGTDAKCLRLSFKNDPVVRHGPLPALPPTFQVTLGSPFSCKVAKYLSRLVGVMTYCTQSVILVLVAGRKSPASFLTLPLLAGISSHLSASQWRSACQPCVGGPRLSVSLLLPAPGSSE